MGLDEAVREYNAVCPANLATATMDDSRIIVFPSGGYDLASSQSLLDMLVKAVEVARPGMSFVVDLSRVTYLPSTAIGALSTALVKAKAKGVAFSAREVPEPIAKIIRLLGFWEYFNIQ